MKGRLTSGIPMDESFVTDVTTGLTVYTNSVYINVQSLTLYFMTVLAAASLLSLAQRILTQKRMTDQS